jgi:DHA2 family multidrug resistance protein-like MFS transporter
MTPWALAVAVSAPIAGRLADRYPAGILGSVGLAILAGGLLLVGSFSPAGAAADFVWRVAICGLGFGLFQSPNNRAIVLSAPRARSGAAGGMLATARLLGQATGAAAVALLFRAHAAQGSHIALHVAAALALVAALVSMTRLSAAHVST